jgi:hypothetical protein
VAPSDVVSSQNSSDRISFLGALGLTFIASVVAWRLVAEPPGDDGFLAPFRSPLARAGSQLLVLACMALTLAVRAAADRKRAAGNGFNVLVFAILAGALTAYHAYLVDRRIYEVRPGVTGQAEEWQRGLYLGVINRMRPPGSENYFVPHVFRPLPYDFTRAIELITHDWYFACFTYRWFFTFWSIWATYRFIEIFHSRRQAWCGPLLYGLLYPFSIQNYLGQLTDPLSHALFILALIYVVEDQWILLAAALALGVWAKETVAIVVPAYAACYWRRGWRTVLITMMLAVVSLAYFLAARLPLGWRLDIGSINSTSALMIRSNLGLGQADYQSTISIYQNYLQPLLFIGIFLPFVAWQWPRADRRLKTLFLTLTPLLLASSLCFSWLYESRNYLPFLPVLTALALPWRNETTPTRS